MPSNPTTEAVDIGDLNVGDHLWWGGSLVSRVESADCLDESTGVIFHVWDGLKDVAPVRTQMPRTLKVNRIVTGGE